MAITLDTLMYYGIKVLGDDATVEEIDTLRTRIKAKSFPNACRNAKCNCTNVTKHSPNGFDIVEECPKCGAAYLVRPNGEANKLRYWNLPLK